MRIPRDKDQNAVELGTKGGLKTLENKGLQHFKDISQKGVEARKAKLLKTANTQG